MKIIRELRQEIDRLRAMIGGNIVSVASIPFIYAQQTLITNSSDGDKGAYCV